MNELTKQQMVIVTRIGVFWVETERANKIKQIREADPTGVIEIDDCQIGVRDIFGILTPAKYSDYQNERRGMWQCQYKQWHPRNDICYCARNAGSGPPPQKELTPEEREKASKKLAEIKAQMKKKGFGSVKR
jgi:hypothetical protein